MIKFISIFTVVYLFFLVSAAASQEVFEAARNGNFEKVKELVEKASKLIAEKANNGETLLHIAASSGNNEITEWLISKGADIEAKDNANNTPLTNAISNRNLETVKTLVEKGVNLNNRGLWNRLPIQIAAIFASKEIVDYLIEKGADIPVEQEHVSNQLLNYSCSRGLEKLFEKLLEKGINIKVNQYTGNLLHLAAEGGSQKIVDVLLEKGFQVMSVNEFGWTPLHCAAEKGNLKVVELLISKGADINYRTKSGKTPYNLADFFGQKSVREFLILKGADKSGQKFPELTGKYLGQKEPGKNPELFALDIISTKYSVHGNIVFSPDGKEAYWSGWFPSKDSPELKVHILTTKLENGKWIKPELASFSKIGYDDDSPFITPDGKKLFFISRRPLIPGRQISNKNNIWYVTREGESWSEPQPLEIVNWLDLQWRGSTDKKGNFYFAGKYPDEKRFEDIFYSKFEKYYHSEFKSLSQNLSLLW